ncbi:MAG: nucleotidyl transferase AbiEii/AbiGii toxin family protein [Verrucomicrobiales bacterium]|nr:nucleotidyl transferase AbiEii/AbiGii toxin family protein [Verrucomicrobiales bacterium]
MNHALQRLIARYQPQTLQDWENALKEIVQELVLLGLWRAKFYQHAAFYGGTALRIFHSLPRFSEDLDFSLLQPTKNFDLSPYLEAIRIELASLGFSFEAEPKTKQVQTTIESAFIKGGTRINLLSIGAPEVLHQHLPKPQKIKIKLEIDTRPPQGADYEVKTLLIPIPFQVKIFTPPCLFAGKLHALLHRRWKQRVKGRDFYDFIWYLSRDIPCHLPHLQQRMEQTGHWDKAETLDLAVLKKQLQSRFETVDFEQAKSDVRPFIKDDAELALWSQEFFIGLLDRVNGV